MNNRVLLIDGNSVLFRAYYATAYSGARMSTKDGTPTNAVYGFINMFNKAIETLEPTHVMVAWDAGKKTFRTEEYKEYKGTRKPVDPELKAQFPIVREFLDSYGIFRYEQEGIEADDIIGTLSNKLDCECLVLTGDNDLVQLVSDHTKVYLMKNGISNMEMITLDNIEELKGVAYPKQIIDLKGLMGDKSDNIPGVPGIGTKTAQKLLASYDSVEGVYDHIDELKGKMKERLVENKDLAFLSKRLATICLDCDVPCDLSDFTYKCNDLALNAFYEKYEMHSFVKKVHKEVVKIDMEVVEVIPSAFLTQPLAIFIDCDNDIFYKQNFYGIALFNKEKIYYVKKDNINDDLLAYLVSDYRKMAFDVKEVYHVLTKENITFKPIDYDLKIASFLIDNETNSLKKLSDKLDMGYEIDREELFGKFSGKKKDVNEEERLSYVKDACNILVEGYKMVSEELINNNLVHLFKNIEMPISEILFEMEEVGVKVDNNILSALSDKVSAKLNSLEKAIFEISGEEFNINSPKQLATILFDKLGLKDIKKRSTSVEVLEKLRDESPIIDLLMEYRKLSKLNSTYALGLQKYILDDGRIHGLFHQNLTQTGRLSSSDPNMQNLSVRDEDAREIRKAFVASDDNHILYGVDYSQIELRVLAHMAHEDNMIEAFNEGIDIHTKTAMELFDCTSDEVDSHMRRQAKAVNFGMVYGQSVYGLSSELGISFNDAKKFMDKYFASYPKIKGFMDEQVKFCEENGYVLTMNKRRRYIPDIKSRNYAKKEFGRRASMNAPIQGSASEVIKLAMIKITNLLKENNLETKLIMQIHDELVFDCLESEKEQVMAIVDEGMKHACDLLVPLIYEGSFSKDYYGCK